METKAIKPFMKKEVTLGQVLQIAITLLIAIVTAWVTINNKVTDQERRTTQLEINQEKIQNQSQQTLTRLESKVDKQGEDLIQVRILLESKANRK